MARVVLTLVVASLLLPHAPAQEGLPEPPGQGQQTDPRPDLAVFSHELRPDEPDDETPFKVCVEVQNYGNGDPTPFNLVILLDDEEIWSKRYRDFPRSGDHVCAEARAEQGTHRVTILVDADEEVLEMSEDNNRRDLVFQVREPKRADLSPILYITPDPPRRGETLSFASRVRNLGSAASVETSVEFLYDGVVIASSILPPLQPGASHLVGAALDADRLREGSHHVQVVVDPIDVVPELNEENNVQERVITLPKVPLADLAVLNLTWDAPVRETFVANVTARVANLGDVDAGSFVVRFVIDNRTIIGAPRLGGLSAGNVTNVTIGWTARGPGNHTLGVVVDAANEVREAFDDNNVRYAPLVVRPATDEPPLPDLLAARLMHLPLEPRPGQPVNLTLVVRNDGPVRAGAFGVTFLVDGVVVATPRYSGLAPRAVIAPVVTWTGGEGTHEVLVLVDEDGALEEASKDNNEQRLVFHVRPPAPGGGAPPTAPTRPPTTPTPGPATPTPERETEPARVVLEVSDVTYFPRVDESGRPDPRVAAKITNRGNAVAPPFVVQFFIDGKLVGTRSFGGLSPLREGTAELALANVEGFEPLAPGPHTLRVHVGPAQRNGGFDVAEASAPFEVEEAPRAFAPGAGAALLVAALACVAILLGRSRRDRT